MTAKRESSLIDRPELSMAAECEFQPIGESGLTMIAKTNRCGAAATEQRMPAPLEWLQIAVREWRRLAGLLE